MMQRKFQAASHPAVLLAAVLGSYEAHPMLVSS